MSVEEIKSEIENLTSKSISDVIAFSLQILNQRDPEATVDLNKQMSDTDLRHQLSQVKIDKPIKSN